MESIGSISMLITYLVFYIPFIIVWLIVVVLAIKLMKRGIVALDSYIEENKVYLGK